MKVAANRRSRLGATFRVTRVGKATNFRDIERASSLAGLYAEPKMRLSRQSRCICLTNERSTCKMQSSLGSRGCTVNPSVRHLGHLPHAYMVPRKNLQASDLVRLVLDLSQAA